MTLSGVNYPGALDLLDNGAKSPVSTEVGVRMLKKSNDQITQQGQAVIQMVEQAGAVAKSTPQAPLLDVYA